MIKDQTSAINYDQISNINHDIRFNTKGPMPETQYHQWLSLATGEPLPLKEGHENFY